MAAVLKNLDFQGIVVSKTTDNAANAINFANLDIVSGDGIRCATHIYNLVVSNTLDAEVGSIRAKCHSIATYFNKSTQASEALQKARRDAGMKPKQVEADVVTRWNSFYLQLKSLITSRFQITSIIAGNPDKKVRDLAPSDDDWIVMQEMEEILKQFYIATEALSGQTYPTLPLVMLTHYALLTHCLSFKALTKQHYNARSRAVAEAMGKSLGEWWEKSSTKVAMVACALDPRTKDMPMFSTQSMQIYQWLVEGVKELHDTGKAVATTTPTNTVPDNMSDYELLIASVSPTNPDESELAVFAIIQNELNGFVKEKQLRVKDDALEWWKIKQHSYPQLARLARRVLCIPGTSVPCERAFSRAGAICTARRACMDAEMLEKLSFIADNWSLCEVLDEKTKQTLVTKATDAAQAAMAAANLVMATDDLDDIELS